MKIKTDFRCGCGHQHVCDGGTIEPRLKVIAFADIGDPLRPFEIPLVDDVLKIFKHSQTRIDPPKPITIDLTDAQRHNARFEGVVCGLLTAIVVVLLVSLAKHFGVTEHVLSKLKRSPGVLRARVDIAAAIKAFAGPNPEFWAYYADYDWVVLCQLYGRMVDLPEGWPMFCRDLKQLAGDVRLPKQETAEHHALNDARWTRDAYLWLVKELNAIQAKLEADPPGWGQR